MEKFGFGAKMHFFSHYGECMNETGRANRILFVLVCCMFAHLTMVKGHREHVRHFDAWLFCLRSSKGKWWEMFWIGWREGLEILTEICLLLGLGEFFNSVQGLRDGWVVMCESK